MRTHRVQCLLMGGQACVLYGAAEFSRDTDLALLASPDNLERLRGALEELQAQVIAVPPFTLEYLERGQAVHFAYGDRRTGRMRIDVMSRMRNVAPFAELWERRTTVALGEAGDADLLSLPDLVATKKTQRDKDWPMVRRLVEVNYLSFHNDSTVPRVDFWLRELRTPPLLIEATARFTERARAVLADRPLLTNALRGDAVAVAADLLIEESAEREADRIYWAPLLEELETLRRMTRLEAQ
jgi:hypothetical protein